MPSRRTKLRHLEDRWDHPAARGAEHEDAGTRSVPAFFDTPCTGSSSLPTWIACPRTGPSRRPWPATGASGWRNSTERSITAWSGSRGGGGPASSWPPEKELSRRLVVVVGGGGGIGSTVRRMAAQRGAHVVGSRRLAEEVKGVREPAVALAPRVRVKGVSPATVVSGSAMSPRDRVIASLAEHGVPLDPQTSDDALRDLLDDFYARRTLTHRPIQPIDCPRAILFLAGPIPLHHRSHPAGGRRSDGGIPALNPREPAWRPSSSCRM